MINTGIYRHYKGPKYMVVAIAETHNHNGDFDVVYISLERGKYCTRPLDRDSRDEDSWNDVVPWPDGIERCRFIKSSMSGDDGLDNLYERTPDGVRIKDPR